MTDARLPLAELLEKAGDGDFLRSVAEAVLQLDRTCERNGDTAAKIAVRPSQGSRGFRDEEHVIAEGREPADQHLLCPSTQFPKSAAAYKALWVAGK